MQYGMSLTDGRIVAWNDEVAKQTAYVHVPEDIAHAVADSTLDWHKVAELVHKKRNNDPTFSWEAFDTLRDHQNIRKAKYDPVEPDKAEEPLPEAVPQVEISMSELTNGPKNVRRAVDNVSSVEANSPAPKAGAKDVKVVV